MWLVAIVLDNAALEGAAEASFNGQGDPTGLKHIKIV